MLDKMNTEEKLDYIFLELGKGIEREEISNALGYKTFKSMDNFVRRQGYIWDGRRNMYYMSEEDKENRRADLVPAPRGKVREIISLFSKKDSCARDIADELGFDGHRDLAKYMTAKGYRWNSELENYERDANNIILDQKTTDDEYEAENKLSISKSYKGLLGYLLEKEEIVKQLINEKEAIEADGIIPRYAIPGVFITKSVHMTNHLDQLVRDFSKEKNISQRELFEVALVELFQKYGYKNEIETLMEQV